MRVRWVWALLDLPEVGFAHAVDYWREATCSGLSRWHGDHDQFATFLPAQGDPWVKVQRVRGPGGVHLDLEVDVPLEEARQDATELGATVLAEVPGPEGTLGVVVGASPGGFVFCLTRWREPELPRAQVRKDQVSLLDQVCLDIPASRYAAEVGFWSGLTGWAARPGSRPEFTPLTRPEGIPVRLLMQRCGDTEVPVSAHVDFACADRGTESARHLALGAEVESQGASWTVLRSPTGRRYCLTDRRPLTGTLA